jgi:hypothetical protein
MPKVYVPQEAIGKNIIPAMSYGQIRVCFPPNYQVNFDTEDAAKQLLFWLSDYTEEDFLLLIGDPILIGIAAACASFWSKGRVKFLKWDRQEHIYLPVSADILKGQNGN